MGQFIPEDIKQSIIEAADVVNIVSRYVKLRKAGSNYKGRCPFHSERTPSFVVSPNKQIFKCFGCGEAGNAVTFFMKIEGLNFHEALIILARESGIEIPKTQSNTQRDGKIKKILKLNETCCKFFQDSLKKKYSFLKEFFKNRNITMDMIDTLRIGYADAEYQTLLNYLDERETDFYTQAGVIKQGNKGRHYDVFRERIIFPIANSRGDIVGFSGRGISEKVQPKYLNSPDTEVFKKRELLYGFNLSRNEIRKKGNVIIVEGYMDFLRLFFNGVKNCVASMGTSLTTSQVKLLKRYADVFIFSYDSDSAGKKATVRAVDEVMGQEEIRCKVIEMPSGEDPDSFIEKFGSGKYLDMVENAADFIYFKLNHLINMIGVDDIYKKVKIINFISKNIVNEGNFILQNDYIKEIAKVLEVDEWDLRSEIGKTAGGKTINFGKKTKKRTTAYQKAIDNLIFFVINDKVDNISEHYEYIPKRYVEFIERILSLKKEKGIKKFGHLLDWLTPEDREILESVGTDTLIQDSLTKVTDDDEQKIVEKIVQDSIRTIKKLYYLRRKKVLEEELDSMIQSGDNPEKLKQLQNEYFNILKFEKMKRGELFE